MWGPSSSGWCLDGWILSPEDQEQYRLLKLQEVQQYKVFKLIQAKKQHVNMYLSVLHLAPKVGPETATEIGRMLGLHQEDKRKITVAKVVLARGEASELVYHSWTLDGWVMVQPTVPDCFQQIM